MANNNDAIQQGLNAAQNAAQEEGMAGKVEELANRLDVGVAGGAGAGAGAGATNAAGGIGGQASEERTAYGTAEIGGAANVAGAADAGAPAASTGALQDGVRYDYDDSANI